MTIDRERRKNRILEAIIKAHTGSALPVGSNHIARELGLSSATIRNIMFELEVEGYIKQPYTSAGRVPTDLGYRRYVDNMSLPKKTRRCRFLSGLRNNMAGKSFYEEVIEHLSSAISKITRYTGIALSPGHKLYFDGTYHMLEQPEFARSQTARGFLRILEEKNEFLRAMTDDLEEGGTKIRIGRENIFEELKECSVVTATYTFKSRVSGNLGIIGPMRMRYEKVVPVVEDLARMTTEIMEDLV